MCKTDTNYLEGEGEGEGKIRITLTLTPSYIDDIFFTSNESLETIHQMLDEANRFHTNIKLVRRLGNSASFLDVFIANNDGILATSVYHKEVSELYIVLFKSDHPRLIFKNIIDAALIRAIRYSSILTAFNKERRSIKLMLLYNGYDFPSCSKPYEIIFLILDMHRGISILNFTDSLHLIVQNSIFYQ